MDTTPPSRALVEAGWQKVRADGRIRPALLEAAYAEPHLRRLFPWTGMGELHFSRCTEQRWTWDIPYIQPATGGGYRVSGPLRGEFGSGGDAGAGRHDGGRTSPSRLWTRLRRNSRGTCPPRGHEPVRRP
ncbi:DUF6193 family natural product biosynthesis protein [Embleya sp. NPDC059237]|uniref:DUF6193 family natural product biosynthesis protein n=1 Tax=Embleya sp. NPDC059237 TaxID=3346784 RepID=UPI0036831B52